MIGDVTGRQFGVKEVQMLGCTLMGGNILAMMASFPTVRRRVEGWGEVRHEVELRCRRPS